MESCGTSRLLTKTSASAGAPVEVSAGVSIEAGSFGSCSRISSVSKGVALATRLPGLRIGNSSSSVVVAMPVPGFRIGNSSSSIRLGMGIGADILPRMDWWPDFGRPDFGRLALEPDFHRLTFMVKLGALRDLLA